MAHKALALALSMIVAASPALAQPDSGLIEPRDQGPVTTSAPSGTPTTRYCMRIELTGNVMDPVRCWTRDQWAEQGVNVDRDWPTEGIRVIESSAS